MPPAEDVYSRSIQDWERGRGERALQGIQRLLAYHPDHLEGQRALVLMLSRRDGAEVAVAFLRERAGHHPQRLGPRFSLAYALASTGGEDAMREAHDLLEAILQQHPHQGLIHDTLAEVLIALDDLPGAADRFLISAAMREQQKQPGSLEARLNAARYRFLIGDVKTTRAILQKARKLAGEVRDLRTAARIVHTSGHLQLALGDLDAAAAAFAEATELARKSAFKRGLVASLSSNAKLLVARQRFSEAVTAATEAVKVAEQMAKPRILGKARLDLAETQRQTGHRDDALQTLQRAAAGLKEAEAWEPLAAVLSLAGHIHHDASEHALAAEALNEAVRIHEALQRAGVASGALAASLSDLGDVALHAGDVEQARKLYRTAEAAGANAGSAEAVRRARSGIVETDLRTSTVEDLALAMEQLSELGPVDPWLEAELYNSQGAVEEAILAAERSLSPSLNISPRDLPVRFALLMSLYLRRRSHDDLERALRAATAGSTAAMTARIHRLQVRVRRGIKPELLEQRLILMARLAGTDEVLGQALPPSAGKVWRTRRAEARAALERWGEQVVADHPAWASLYLPLKVYARLPLARPPKGAANVTLVAGEQESLAFVTTHAGVGLVKLLPITGLLAGMGAGAETAPQEQLFWNRLAPTLQNVKRIRLMPPAGLLAFPWGRLKAGKKSAAKRYEINVAPFPAHLHPPRSKAESDSAPTPPAQTQAETPLETMFNSDLTGETLRSGVSAFPSGQLAMETWIRAALYAGAKEVKIDTGRAGPGRTVILKND